jgi:hypothetical protein
MDSNSEEELRKELEATKRKLYDEQMLREAEEAMASSKAWARESKAATNTASIVLFGGIAIIFLLAIMGVS